MKRYKPAPRINIVTPQAASQQVNETSPTFVIEFNKKQTVLDVEELKAPVEQKINIVPKRTTVDF